MDIAAWTLSPFSFARWSSNRVSTYSNSLAILVIAATVTVLRYWSGKQSCKQLRDQATGAHVTQMPDGRQVHWKLPSVSTPLHFCRSGQLARTYSLQNGTSSWYVSVETTLWMCISTCRIFTRTIWGSLADHKHKPTTVPESGSQAFRHPATGEPHLKRHVAEVAFTGVKLDASSVEALSKAFKSRISVGWTFQAHPMNICCGSLSDIRSVEEILDDAAVQKLQEISVGQSVTLQVVSISQDAGVLAVKVLGCFTTSRAPHVVFAYAPDHHPSESNYITQWEDLQDDTPLLLEGTVCEFLSSPGPVSPASPKPLLRTLSGYRHEGFEHRSNANDMQLPQLPRLVRGLTGHSRDDHQAIADMVADVLQDDGWAGVDRKCIVVDDRSGRGYGGSKTYKVTGPGMNPPVVGLHSRSEAATADPLAEARMEAAATLFAQADLAPQRLAQGGDWFIDPWMGEVVGRSKGQIEDSELLRELAALLASIHKLPTDWYNSWRERICEHLPALRKSSHGSHIWWYTTPLEKLGALTESALQTWATADFFAPVSPAAARIVCCHGDFHPANIIRTSTGVVTIDFEFSCVGSAVMDVAWAMSMWLKDLTQKREFVKAYLECSDLLAREQEVDAFILDAEIAFIGQANCPLLWRCLERRDWQQDSSYDLELYHAYAAFVEDIRHSSLLSLKVIENGFQKCSDAWLAAKVGPPNLDSHWCAMPPEAEWRCWAEENNGLAVRRPEQVSGSWRVWCFCGDEMSLKKLQKSRVDTFYCHCGQVSERYTRPAGHLMWECGSCAATASVADPSSGEPRGVPASPACRALRYHGHALIDCLGKKHAYQGVLHGDFHFALAGVVESVQAVNQLREALVAQPRKNLLRLQDDAVGVEALQAAISSTKPADLEVLLHGYANAGRPGLIEVLLKAGACNVNAQRAKDGCTALHLAYFRNHVEVINVLNAYGADPSIKSKYGETPAQAVKPTKV